MKKIFLMTFLVSWILRAETKAQIVCIYCYDQNDSISQNVNNLIQNGSFENTNCQPNIFSNSFCPNANYYGCDIVGWTCTGGGVDSYASIDDSTFTKTADGALAAYFGNGSQASACSQTFNDTSCLVATGCELLNIPAGYPTNDASYGGSTGVSLEQTVTGLNVGSTYVLEFWAGGEPQSHGWMDAGVFAVDIGFGKTFLRNKPTCPTCIGTTYVIEFNAVSTSHTIKFTNWGHICIPCTELILDNVRLYTLAELSPSVPSCATVPVALFTAPNHICPGTCTGFTNTSVNASSYVWTFQGAVPSTSTDINPTNICYNTPGTYDVSLIATGAGGTDTLTLPNFITVYPFPQAQGISQSGDTLFAVQGAVSYQWYHNGNIIPGATDYYYVASTGGNYNVVATDANGCEVEAVIFDVTAEVASLLVNNALELFPNPVMDELFIKGLPQNTNIEISIKDLPGKTMFRSKQSSQAGIDCSLFPEGIYIMEVISGEKHFYQKFIRSDAE